MKGNLAMPQHNSCMGIFRFSKKYYDLFDQVIYPLVQTHTGLICHDARSYYEAQTIKMDLISRMIEESNLLIIDISENNPNVFLEFGIAYNLRKPTIIICGQNSFKRTWKRKIPFDLQGRELLIYKNKTDLRIKLGRYIFDSLYRTFPAVLSWKSKHPHNHIKSNSEISFFSQGEIWSDKPVHPNFTIRYHVKIIKVLNEKNPDMRLIFSHESNSLPNGQQQGYPRIVIIFPWEFSEKAEGKYECHIDYFNGAMEAHERLQQIAVVQPDISKISNTTPLEYDFFVTFCWPNLIVESSLFEEDKARLVVPVDSFRERGYPLHLRQFIAFSSANCHATIKEINIREIQLQ